MLKKYGWLILVVAFALVFWLGQQTGQSQMDVAPSTSQDAIPKIETPIPTIQSAPVDAKNTGTTLPDFLPPEAQTTLDLIARGGPFPHRQDGVVFQNREKRLPKKDRGYYHEYTVATPGLHHRGARRIVTGGNPIEVYYYTDDHYDSFRKFEVEP